MLLAKPRGVSHVQNLSGSRMDVGTMPDDVACGSISEVEQRPAQVRSCLNSGRAETATACPFRANERHRRMPQRRDLLQLKEGRAKNPRIFATRGVCRAPLSVWWHNGEC